MLIVDNMRLEFPAPESVGRYYDLWFDEIRSWLGKFGNIQLDTSETLSNISKKHEPFIMETFPGSDTANIIDTASAKANHTIGLASEYSSHLLAMVAAGGCAQRMMDIWDWWHRVQMSVIWFVSCFGGKLRSCYVHGMNRVWTPLLQTVSIDLSESIIFKG
jgi:hypothetical protein